MAPCYLVVDKTIYKADGSNKKEYEVVFCYKLDTTKNEIKGVVPNYNFDGQCLNSHVVNDVDLDYKKIKTICDIKNNDRMTFHVTGVSLDDTPNFITNYKQTIDKHYKLLKTLNK